MCLRCCCSVVLYNPFLCLDAPLACDAVPMGWRYIALLHLFSQVCSTYRCLTGTPIKDCRNVTSMDRIFRILSSGVLPIHPGTCPLAVHDSWHILRGPLWCIRKLCAGVRTNDLHTTGFVNFLHDIAIRFSKQGTQTVLDADGNK